MRSSEASPNVAPKARELDDLTSTILQLTRIIDGLHKEIEKIRQEALNCEQQLRSNQEITPNPVPPPNMKTTNYFSEQVLNFMAGAAKVSAKDLLEKFDPGIPFEKERGAEEAWLFYSAGAAVPSTLEHNFDTLDVTDALSKCHSVEIIPRDDPSNGHTCFALVGMPVSLFVPSTFRWMNMNYSSLDMGPQTQYKQVGRGAEAGSDFDYFTVDEYEDILQSYRKKLAAYLAVVDDKIIPAVRPILESKATSTIHTQARL